MKRILNTILFLFAALTMVAQNSFVVADKNGNSQLVQSLIFQQQQNADRFTWKADGTNTGDIKDLLFIARAQAQLATASSNDVTEMLEELSGTDLADAEGIAASLKNNENVAEAISEDGNNVVVKLKGSDSHIVYPLYEEADIISDYAFSSQDAKNGLAPKKSRHQGNVFNGTVAIFNHFSGISGYSLQNRIVSNIKVMFELNGYDVAYYGTNPSNNYNGNIDYEQFFDNEHLTDVIQHSSEYDAILIFSHGYIWNGKSYFATGEKVKTSPGEELYCFEKEDGEYYYSYPVEALKTNNRCIMYLGSCYGVPAGGYSANSFIKEKNSCFIGWNGKNRVAQADAMMLFNFMLKDGLTLDRAIACTYNNDPWNAGTERYEYNTANHSLDASSKPSYVAGKKLSITSTNSFYRKEDNKTYIEIRVKAQGNWSFPAPIRIKLESMLYGVSEPSYEHFFGFLFSDQEQVTHIVVDNNTPEDLYSLYALTTVNGKWERVQITPPRAYIYSNNLSDNYSVPVPPESEIRKPVVIDSNGQPVSEITLPAGSSKTFEVDAYSGHELSTPCLDKNVCTVSISGTTLTVTGVSEGTTYFGVLDKQNRQIAVVKVSVTASGGEPSYTSCPDDHHPHLIDLGLPSGTKWACCNVGADKPEGYGGYYAWGETEEKDYYDWSTYIHCDGSEDNCHDIGTDIAGTQYDAATANWGSPWVMPSLDQVKELLDNCTSELTTENGVFGCRFTASNGASIFLPAAGGRWYYELGSAGSVGDYWSSSDWPNDDVASDLCFDSGLVGWYCNYRYYGLSVRPVRKN